jgi:hypothetical protein
MIPARIRERSFQNSSGVHRPMAIFFVVLAIRSEWVR